MAYSASKASSASAGTLALPSGTSISTSMPSKGDSISIKALSVSTSAMTSPALIRSPTCFSQRGKVPFAIEEGIRSFVCMRESGLHQCPHRAHDRVSRRNDRRFELVIEGHRRITRGHTNDRGMQSIKCLFRDQSGHFGPEAPRLASFVHDEQTMGLADRGENCLLIQRPNGARIDHFH